MLETTDSQSRTATDTAWPRVEHCQPDTDDGTDRTRNRATIDRARNRATIDRARNRATIDRARNRATIDRARNRATTDRARNRATTDKTYTFHRNYTFNKKWGRYFHQQEVTGPRDYRFCSAATTASPISCVPTLVQPVDQMSPVRSPWSKTRLTACSMASAAAC